MREIEFRAWLKDEKRMTNVVRLDLLENDDNDICIIYRVKPYLLGKKHSKYFELMQNTGLKDKNGVKIFEGDIVKFERKNFEVKYSFGRFVIGLNMPISSIRSDCEVIGNIYENKELLGWFE